ncbi:hypothetical protein [Parasphingorhabdus sp. NYA22]
MKRLENFLAQQPACALLEERSLIHTASGEIFLDILECGKIIPSECLVFNREKLAYFFLGRPAYKTSIVHDPSFWQLPAVFFLKRPQNLSPKRIHPFDSGALHSDRYRQIIGKLKIEDFEIDPTWQSVSKLINYFFGSIDEYQNGTATSYQDIRNLIGNETSQFIPLALAKLYNSPSNAEIDDRVKLIEFQYDSEIELASGNLAAVIVCKEWLRDPSIEKKLSNLGCEIKSYPLFPLSSSSYYSKIYELAQDIK